MSCALESFVNKVKNNAATESFVDLYDYLKEHLDLLTKNWNILDNVLDSLDIQKHTIAIVHVLATKFECATVLNTDTMQLSNMLQDFLDNCNDEDLLRALNSFHEMIHNYTNFVINQPNNISCINLLSDAVDKVRVNMPLLTPIHSDLMQLCLKAQHFDIALKYLDIDLTEISKATPTSDKDTEKTQVDVNYEAKYCLQYFYYGGMIYTAVKDYERALYFYELCLSVPAMALSHIMLDAYKKFILVSLILRGRLAALSKQSSNMLTRYMKPASLVYHDLVTAYSTHDSETLNAVVNKNIEIYKRDNNRGLVKQVVDSLYKFNIQRLTKTFITLSLEDVAEKVQLASNDHAERYILSMVKSGEIYASINRIDGMVVFHDCPERFNSLDKYLDMQQMLNDASDWIKQYNLMEEKILLNPLFIKLSGQEEESNSSPKTFAAFDIEIPVTILKRKSIDEEDLKEASSSIFHEKKRKTC